MKYLVDWSKVAEATKVLLEIPESNLDREDSESLIYNENGTDVYKENGTDET